MKKIIILVLLILNISSCSEFKNENIDAVQPNDKANKYFDFKLSDKEKQELKAMAKLHYDSIMKDLDTLNLSYEEKRAFYKKHLYNQRIKRSKFMDEVEAISPEKSDEEFAIMYDSLKRAYELDKSPNFLKRLRDKE